ncbi:MAG TPA: deoxyribonuclease IV [Thermoleophilaceae bacterium]|jgi:deoxyribonuclease-4|nr:deoxyribonuclease IV [Thermoleophilaceae bacterium]
MLLGAHVSTAGGLVKAHERGVESESEAIQIFNQSPRMWRPTNYKPDEIAEFNERMAGGPVNSVVIHAVYLINCASNEPEIREKSIVSLTHALLLGDAIGADGVVVHPGTLKGKPLAEGLELAGEAFRIALSESDKCPLLLENTAGAKGTLGRSFTELADLLERGGGAKRLGICLDSCHLLASGFEVRTRDGLTEVLDECVEAVGIERLQCLHVNDSQVSLGGNRDRHARLTEGEFGAKGLRVFLSEPRFDDLPVCLETPGPSGKIGIDEVKLARKLRAAGLKARSAGARRAGRRTRG